MDTVRVFDGQWMKTVFNLFFVIIVFPGVRAFARGGSGCRSFEIEFREN